MAGMASQRFTRFLLALFILFANVSARIYYDSVSCKNYVKMLDEVVPAAFEMAQLAQVAIGGPIQDIPDSPWGFPDTESRDLAGRIFGSLYRYAPMNAPWNYQYIKNGLEYILNNFAWPVPGGAASGTAQPDPNLATLQATDVMMYCDLSRFERDNNPQTSKNNDGYYVNSKNTKDRISDEDYETCNSSPRLKFLDAAVTQPTGDGLEYPIIQLCPWYLDLVRRFRLRLKVIILLTYDVNRRS
ncbi:hypothetical protein NHQ30_004034 [Ciborinia camelliae]|nr:hypothetical protein NHQ30_004034 [Ciborinia camelliae]